MDLQFKKIDSLLSEKRIKLHLFEPSNRKIWQLWEWIKSIGWSRFGFLFMPWILF